MSGHRPRSPPRRAVPSIEADGPLPSKARRRSGRVPSRPVECPMNRIHAQLPAPPDRHDRRPRHRGSRSCSCPPLSRIGSLQGTMASSREVAHTVDLLDRMRGLLSDVKDAETGQRGYLLTGAPSYLAPYTAAQAGVPAEVAALRTLRVRHAAAGRTGRGARAARADQDGRDARDRDVEAQWRRRRCPRGGAQRSRQGGDGRHPRDHRRDAEGRTGATRRASGRVPGRGPCDVPLHAGRRPHAADADRDRRLAVRAQSIGSARPRRGCGPVPRASTARSSASSSLEALGDRVLSFLARYVDAPLATLYVTENDGRFTRLAGFADRDGDGRDARSMPSPVAIVEGSGLLGQVARDRQRPARAAAARRLCRPLHDRSRAAARIAGHAGDRRWNGARGAGAGFPATRRAAGLRADGARVRVDRGGDPLVARTTAHRRLAGGDPAAGRGVADAAGGTPGQQRGARGAGQRAEGVAAAARRPAGRARADQLASRRAGAPARGPEGRVAPIAGRARREGPRARTIEPVQERVPREHEPRVADAAEFDADPRQAPRRQQARQPDRGAGALRRDHLVRGTRPAAADQRHPRPVEDRGAQGRGRVDADRRRAGREGAGQDLRPDGARQGHRVRGRRRSRRAGPPSDRRAAARADPAQPAVERVQVHREGTRDAAGLGRGRRTHRDGGRGQRHRHYRRPEGDHLRGVPPGGRQHASSLRRHGPGAVDLARPRAPARRKHLRREHAGAWQRVHARSARRVHGDFGGRHCGPGGRPPVRRRRVRRVRRGAASRRRRDERDRPDPERSARRIAGRAARQRCPPDPRHRGRRALRRDPRRPRDGDGLSLHRRAHGGRRSRGGRRRAFRARSCST